MTTLTVAASPAHAAPRPIAAARSVPGILLRVEGLFLFVLALLAWRMLGGGWALLGALFLVPDLSMVGYLASPRLGAALYNAGHALVGPGVLALAGALLPSHAALLAAALWAGHIGLDRALGYGLKYPTAFRDTHLTRV